MIWWFLMLRETSEVWSLVWLLVGVVLLVWVSLMRLVSLMWEVVEVNLDFQKKISIRYLLLNY
jgi:hypothetical protein